MSKVTIHTTESVDEGVIKVVAHAEWVDDKSSEVVKAASTRELDIVVASTQVGVTEQEFVEATKRDALRELVTMLNVHGVL